VRVEQLTAAEQVGQAAVDLATRDANSPPAHQIAVDEQALALEALRMAPRDLLGRLELATLERHLHRHGDDRGKEGVPIGDELECELNVEMSVRQCTTAECQLGAFGVHCSQL
jgi:hypothetical protein